MGRSKSTLYWTVTGHRLHFRVPTASLPAGASKVFKWISSPEGRTKSLSFGYLLHDILWQPRVSDQDVVMVPCPQGHWHGCEASSRAQKCFMKWTSQTAPKVLSQSPMPERQHHSTSLLRCKALLTMHQQKMKDSCNPAAWGLWSLTTTTYTLRWVIVHASLFSAEGPPFPDTLQQQGPFVSWSI